jgi:hypothetical protein
MIGYLRDIRDGLGVAVFTVICILGAMAVIGGLTWAGIGISNAVSNSTAKSIGNAQVKRDTDSGANQEAASGIFNQLWTQIQGYETQLKQAKAAGTDATDLTALEQTCDQAVGQYNSDLGTITLSPYVPAHLPTTAINLTVCD